MDLSHRWYFSKEELACTPSRKSIDAMKELSYRQQAANFLQDIGRRLQVSLLCINTATVYMHRFYVYHSFTEFPRYSVSLAALFLATKLEDQRRPLEHVIKVAHICLNKDAPPLDVRSEVYADMEFEVLALESVLLQTLGFELAIEHPHTYVVKACRLVKAGKDLAKASYFMASTSLRMTTMCLQYKPTVVACVCFHMACKWTSWKIEPCSEGREWYFYVDKCVTLELLESLTQEFTTILESSPPWIRRRVTPPKNIPRALAGESSSKHHSADIKSLVIKKDVSYPGPSTSTSSSAFCIQTESKPLKSESVPERSAPSAQSPSGKKVQAKVSSRTISVAAYRARKESERLKQNPALPLTEVSVQPVLSKPHHALNEQERAQNHPSNSLEPHSHVMKNSNESYGSRDLHPVHVASMNKLNHRFAKEPESAQTRESRSNTTELPSIASTDPAVVFGTVDDKSRGREAPAPEVSLPQPAPNKMTNIHYYKYVAPGGKVNSKEPLGSLPVFNSPVPELNHQERKTNSLRVIPKCAETYNERSRPAKYIKRNRSMEVCLDERKSAIVNSVACVDTPDHSPNEHEMCEKHEAKHSSNSKEKSKRNHSGQANPSTTLRNRKDIICFPDSHQKSQTAPGKREGPLKSKLSKSPAPEAAKRGNPASLKLIVTEDKSASQSYCTSHENERRFRKRILSPRCVDAKHSSEESSKRAKLDDSLSSQPNVG